MTEGEKMLMLAGQLYDCGHAELIEQWHNFYKMTELLNFKIREMLNYRLKII